MNELENQRVLKMARNITESSEHDQLVLMMAQYFKKLGYSEIKADITGWTKPDNIFWTNLPDQKYCPDVTCLDTNGIFVILEAETCSTLNDTHTKEQFEIFKAHAKNKGGRFEVVVPRTCAGADGRNLISRYAIAWGIVLDNIWTPA